MMESVGHLLDQSSRKHKHKPFLIFEGKKLSFDQFNRRVNRAANALRNLGVSKGDKVSVMLPNGFDFPVCWLALAKLGAVIVPTNITYKEYDLAYVLSDSEASAIIVHRDCLSSLETVKPQPPLLKTVIVAGADSGGYPGLGELIDKAPDKFAIEDVAEKDLLNIQYTSGTTGFPKGCMLTHRYWLSFGKAMSDFYEPMPSDIDLTAQPYYYLDPQWNTIVCMMAGIPLVILERFSPSKFWRAVKENNVTFFYVMGIMPLFLLKQEENPEWEKNHRLRFVVCSGIVTKLHVTFEKRWNVCWREAYGSTESGGDLSVPLDNNECVGTGTVGIPLSTKEAKIVDKNGVEVPAGKIGELLVRGDPMMSGYWKKPEATAEAFSNGWRRTGDLFSKDEKGYFYITGRLKDMIRRGGENISSAEVEAALIEHPAIRLAAVVPVPDELRGEEVKAYVVLQEEETSESLTPEDIVAFVGNKLASFKVPRYIEYTQDLPRTPSERIAKHTLIQAKKDLRTGSYDVVDKVWR